MVVSSATVQNGSSGRLVTVELIAVEGQYTVETPFGVYSTGSPEVAVEVFEATVKDLESGVCSSVAI